MSREQAIAVLNAMRSVAVGSEKRAQAQLARKGCKDPTYWAMAERVERENAEALAVAVKALEARPF